MENPATRYIIFGAAVFLALSFGVVIDQHKCLTITAIVVLLVYALDNYGSYRKFLPAHTAARASALKEDHPRVLPIADEGGKGAHLQTRRQQPVIHPSSSTIIEPIGEHPEGYMFSEYQAGAPYIPSPSLDRFIDTVPPLPMPHPYQRTVDEMYKYRQHMQ